MSKITIWIPSMPQRSYSYRRGDCQVIHDDGKNCIIIDGGEDFLCDQAIKYCKNHGISHITYILSHWHYDHDRGMKLLLDSSLIVDKIYCPPPADLTKLRDSDARDDYSRAMGRIAQANNLKKSISYPPADQVTRIKVGTIVCDIWRRSVRPSENVDYQVNNTSLVCYFPELYYMTSGDTINAINTYLANKYGTIKVFKIPHHGNACTTEATNRLAELGAELCWYNHAEAYGTSIGGDEFSHWGALYCKNKGFICLRPFHEITMVAAGKKLTVTQNGSKWTFDVPYTGVVPEGWVHNHKGWWYRLSDGGFAKGWRKCLWSKEKVDGSWFLFGEDGYMKTGWQKVNGKWYFFDEKSGAMRKGWIFWGGSWFYLDPESGVMQTGWIDYKQKRCYLEPSGRALRNCDRVIDGKTYRFDDGCYAVELTSSAVSTVKPGMKVIDISEFQPEDIDWNKVKTSGHAVVLRMGLRGSIKGTPRYRKVGYDYHFKMYVEGVIKAGIPYSVYYFPTPLSDAEADQEADWIIMNVAGLNLSMPLWLDSEKVRDGVANDISTAERTRYLKRITDKLVAAGIPCGIYASTSWLNNQINMSDFPQQVLDNTWCAQYAASCTYGGVYAMWQYSSKARVDGINDEIDISIVNRAFNMSCKKTASKSDAMAKDNVKIFPTTNPVKISNSGSDEHGNYKGGAAGDNTGKEWYIRDWYNRPWNCVLRHPDPEVRACLADLATKAANNNRIGYDQYQRETYWRELQKVNYDPSKITVACEADCSAGVIANIKAAGYLLGRPELQNITCTYTGNMRAGLRAAGFACLTDSRYLTSSAFLVAGDVLLNDKHHTATAVTNGIQSDGSIPTAATMPLLKKGSQGATVKKLQQTLNGKGYKLTEDGDFGNKTEAAVKAFQKANGLEVDGEVGPMTWGVLLK